MSEVVITFRAIDLVTPVAKSIQKTIGKITQASRKMDAFGKSVKNAVAPMTGISNVDQINKVSKGLDTRKLDTFKDVMKENTLNMREASLAAKGLEVRQGRLVNRFDGKAITNYNGILKAGTQANVKMGFSLHKLQTSVLGVGLGFLFFGMMVSKVFNRLIKSTTQFYEQVTEGTTEASQALAGFAAGFEFLKFTIGEAIGIALEPLLPLFFDIVDAVADWIDQNPELAGTLSVLGATLGTLSLVFGQFLLFGAALVSFFANIGIASGVSATAFGGLGAAVSGVITVVGFLAQAFVIVVGAISFVIGIVTFATSIWNDFIKIIDLAVKFIGQIFSGDFKGAWETFTEIVNTAISLFIKTILAIPLSIAEGVFQILNEFTGLDLSLTNVIDNLVDGVFGLFSGLMQWIIELLGPGLGDILVGFIQFGVDVIKAIAEMVGGIIGWFLELLDGGIKFATDLYTGVVQLFKNMLNGIVGALQGGLTLITTAINDIVDAVKNPIESLLDDAFGWGKNLIDGFADGINAGISGVLGAVDNVLSEIDDFMPHSPAKKGPLKDIVRWGKSFTDTFNSGVASVPFEAPGLAKLGTGINTNIAPVGVPNVGNGTSIDSGNNVNFSPTINVEINGDTSVTEQTAFFENLIEEFWTQKMRDYVGNTGGAL